MGGKWSKTHITTVIIDDETVLNLTKKRLQTLRAKSYSLEKLAVRTFLKNIRFYLDSDDQLEQLKSLPGVLREKFLQTLITRKIIDDTGKTEIFEDLMGIFPYLLSTRTRCIELNGIMSFACPDPYLDKKATECCVQLLQWIETLAPKVETLIIKQNHPFKVFRKVLVKPGMLQSLMKLQSLKTLHMDLYWFKKKDLLEMCKNLPNLHTLNILCHDSGPDLSPEVFTSSLCNVKQITVNNFCWLADLCNEHLPDVEIVPFNQSQFFDWFSILSAVFYCDYFRNPHKQCQQHVYMDLATNEIHSRELQHFPVSFQNVSCLTAGLREYDEYLEASTLPQFDNIRQLNLAAKFKGRNVLILERFLSTYGQNLQTLCLSSDDWGFRMDLAIISKYCPELEKLSLDYCCLKSSTLPTEAFTELKELEWRYHHVFGSEYENDRMILSNILSAPKLEKVVLEGTRFDEADLLRLNSLIQEKKILSQLHTFQFYLDLDSGNKGIKKYLTNILKSACAFLPKLSDFRVGRKWTLYDHPLRPTPIIGDDEILDECICNLLYLFENEK